MQHCQIGLSKESGILNFFCNILNFKCWQESQLEEKPWRSQSNFSKGWIQPAGHWFAVSHLRRSIQSETFLASCLYSLLTPSLEGFPMWGPSPSSEDFLSCLQHCSVCAGDCPWQITNFSSIPYLSHNKQRWDKTEIQQPQRPIHKRHLRNDFVCDVIE